MVFLAMVLFGFLLLGFGGVVVFGCGLALALVYLWLGWFVYILCFVYIGG
jgi:hypothetical protein